MSTFTIYVAAAVLESGIDDVTNIDRVICCWGDARVSHIWIGSSAAADSSEDVCSVEDEVVAGYKVICYVSSPDIE